MCPFRLEITQGWSPLTNSPNQKQITSLFYWKTNGTWLTIISFGILWCGNIASRLATTVTINCNLQLWDGWKHRLKIFLYFCSIKKLRGQQGWGSHLPISTLPFVDLFFNNISFFKASRQWFLSFLMCPTYLNISFIISASSNLLLLPPVLNDFFSLLH